MEEKISPAEPPYRQRPSARLGPTQPVAPPPWQPSQFIAVNSAAPAVTAAVSPAYGFVSVAPRGTAPPAAMWEGYAIAPGVSLCVGSAPPLVPRQAVASASTIAASGTCRFIICVIG